MSIVSKNLNDVRQAPLDLATPGQNGFMPVPHLFSSSANYVRQPTRAVLINAPSLLSYMDNPPYAYAALKALIESRPQSWDGLTSSVTWDFDGPAVGNAGEKLESVIKASRAVSAPACVWSEAYGMAIARFWTEFGRLIIMDPDLQFPGIVAMARYLQAGSPPILPEAQGMTILFFEADPTYRSITNAWLCSNVQPRSAGDIIGKMEKGGSSEVPTVSIEFTAFTQVGEAVYNLAQSYLQSINLQDLRPLNLKGIATKVSPRLDAVRSAFNTQMGLAADVTTSTLALNL